MSVSGSALSSVQAQLATISTTSSPPEVYSARFTTSLTAAITSGLRPTVISVAATNARYGQGTFSIAIYDAGTDANPVNFEALEVTGGGGGLNWTVVTEQGWNSLAHANGSTVVATVLTPRSIQQPLNNHISTNATPDPHSIYLRKSSFTTKGQLLAGTGQGTFTPLAVGSNGTSPVADSTQPSGIRWSSLSIANTLQHLGDLIVGGVLGAITRLAIGNAGQQLTVVQNTAAIANPVAGPSCSATGSGGSLLNGNQYDFAYAWQNGTSPDGGITQISPLTTFTATTTGIVAVQCPAAPASGITLVIYAAGHGSQVQQQATQTNASTSSPNTVTVSAIHLGAVGSNTNTTGGLSAQWMSDPINQLVNAQLHASATLTANALPSSFGASGVTHGRGAVPDPGAIVGATRYLREDATWNVPSVAVPSVNLIATASLTAVAAEAIFGPSGPNHSSGDVPDPGTVAGTLRFLREDATWAPPGASVATISLGATATMRAVPVTLPLYANIQEQETSGTNGGTSTSGAWQPRVLNTIVSDVAGITSLATNQITLQGGYYRVRASAPASAVNQHQLRLQDLTRTVTLLLGQNAQALATAGVQTAAEVDGRFWLAGATTIQLQHQCTTTVSTTGFGVAGSFGTEVYADIEIWKEG